MIDCSKAQVEKTDPAASKLRRVEQAFKVRSDIYGWGNGAWIDNNY